MSSPLPKTPLKLEAFLPYRLAVISRAVSQTIAEVYEDRFDLTIPEWRVMALLGRFQPISSNEIVKRGAMDKAKVSRAVARLDRKGMIIKETDPNDNRLLLLNLSDEGEKLFRQIVPLAREWEKELLQGFSEEEIAIFHQYLTRIEDRVVELEGKYGKT